MRIRNSKLRGTYANILIMAEETLTLMCTGQVKEGSLGGCFSVLFSEIHKESSGNRAQSIIAGHYGLEKKREEYT